MPIVKNKSTEENREFWSHVETVAQNVPKIQGWRCSSTASTPTSPSSTPSSDQERTGTDD
jgi:hypothetical protein